MDSEELPELRHGIPSWRCGLLLCIIILNVFLPSLVLSYGVIFAYTASQGVPEWMAIICPTLLTITYGVTQCWCREAADSWGGPAGHRVMATLGLMLIFIGLLACAFTPSEIHPFLYGGLGGVGTSIVSAQVDAVIFDTYDSRVSIVRGFCYAGQAIGQFLLPHIFLQLIEFYGLSMFYLILSALILQTLPCILLLKSSQSITRIRSISRYSDFSRNYAIFSNDATTSSYASDLQLNDLSKKCWKSPSDDNIHMLNEKEDFGKDTSVENPTTITPPPSPEEKRKNMFGIDILPEIPEESEDSASDDSDDSAVENNRNSRKIYLQSAIKRLSVMSDNFDDYITRTNDSLYSELDENDNKRYSEIDVAYSNIPPMTEFKRENVLNSFNYRFSVAISSLKRKFRIPSYKLYRIRRRFTFCAYSFNDTFVKPLSRSLSCWQFYPALLLCFSKLSLTLLSSALIPYFSLRTFPVITLIENNFLLSLHSFTWLCFLMTTPWIAQLPKSNYKYIVVGGLIVSTISLFVICTSVSHEDIAIGCVIAGFGFGAITSTWETAARDFVGARKWSKIHSTLETLSGTTVGLFVFGLMYLIDMDEGLKLCIMVLAGAQALVTAVWLIIAVFKFYLSAVKSYKLTESIWS